MATNIIDTTDEHSPLRHVSNHGGIGDGAFDLWAARRNGGGASRRCAIGMRRRIRRTRRLNCCIEATAASLPASACATLRHQTSERDRSQTNTLCGISYAPPDCACRLSSSSIRALATCL